MNSNEVDIVLTVVGQNALETVQYALRCIDIVDINWLNPINTGKFGNFKTLTYLVRCRDTNVIGRRKRIMRALSGVCDYLLPVSPRGDSFRIYIFDERPFTENSH